MKKIIALALAILLAMSVLPVFAAEETHDWAKDGVLRILGIGNSYTEDTFWQLPDVARALGLDKVEVYICMIGGCTVTKHISMIEQEAKSYTLHTNTNGTWKTTQNVSVQEVAALGGWDFVTMQEQSAYAGDSLYLGDAGRLGGLLKELCPTAELVWNMTWSYPNEYSTTDFITLYQRDNVKMYKCVVQTVQDRIVPLEIVDRIIPNGTAIQNARETYLGDAHTTLFRDKLHLSMYEGRTIAAMNTLATLTGVDVSPMADKLNGSEYAKIAVEAVQHAQENPWAVTDSQYPSRQAQERAAQSAEKTRYPMQTSTYEDNAGGWALFTFGDYNYLGSEKRGKQFGMLLGHGEGSNELQLTMPEEGSMDLAYMYNPPASVPAYLKSCALSMKVHVPEGFAGELTFRLCNGKTINLNDCRCWVLKDDSLAPGLNEVTLSAADAVEGGYFDTEQFKGLQIGVKAPAGTTITIAQIALIAE